MLPEPCITLLTTSADIGRTLAISRTFCICIIGFARKLAVKKVWQRMNRILLTAVLNPLREAVKARIPCANLVRIKLQKNFPA